MIFRRIASALKRQDWYSVGIEFVEEEIAIELPAVRAALDALETCSDDAEMLRAVNDGLAFIGGTSGLFQRDSALRELADTPRLLALQSPEVRRRIADLLFYWEIVENEARFYELMPFEARPELIPVLSLGPWMERRARYLGIDYSGERRVLQLNVPVSTACKSKELVAALWAWVRWQSVLPILFRKMREEYRLTINMLGD